MAHPNPMVDLCSLLAHGELTPRAFADWSGRHYGPVLHSSQVLVLLEDFDSFVAQLSSTDLSRSLLKLRPVISRLARSVQHSSESETTDRRDELLAAVGAKSGEIATRAILAWISRHYGDIEPSHVGAILADFDAVLPSAGGAETAFTRSLLQLRGALALRAESAPTASHVLTHLLPPGPMPAEASPPEPVTAEASPSDAPESSRWVRSDAITFGSS